MKSIQDRYLQDPLIHSLVDSLESHIHNLQLTPSEIRECATLAAIHYESNSSRSYYLKEKPSIRECKSCQGQGYFPIDNNHTRQCKDCKGSGTQLVESKSSTIKTNPLNIYDCPGCSGRGFFLDIMGKEKCNTCNGTGMLPNSSKLLNKLFDLI